MADSRNEVAREGRIARSWRLSKLALRIVRSDPAILGLAAASTVIAAVLLGVVYDVTGVFSAHHHRTSGHLALVTLIAAFPLTFVSVFFNTAIAAAVSGVLDGRRLTVRQALTVPSRRLGQVALWSLLAGVVGVLFRQLADRLPLLGSIGARLLGLSWSLATLFVVPILATEGCSAPECLRRSARLVKRRWGEGVSGNLIVSIWTVVAVIPLGILVGFGVASSRGDSGLRIAFVAAGVIGFALIAAVSGVIRESFNVVLYRYASTGQVVGGFSESDLSTPFRPAGIARSGDQREPGPLVGWNAFWPWLVSAVVGTVLVTLAEINKHHYAAHRLSGRIAGAIAIGLFLMLLVRGVIWIASRALRS